MAKKNIITENGKASVGTTNLTADSIQLYKKAAEELANLNTPSMAKYANGKNDKAEEKKDATATAPSAASVKEEPTVRTSQASSQQSNTETQSINDTQSATASEGRSSSKASTEFNVAKANELAQPILDIKKQAYGIDNDGKVNANYWYDVLGIDPAALKQQRAADEQSARTRSKASALAQTFMAANDLFGNLIGARVAKREKDNTAKEEQERARQLRELISAEDNARIQDASKRQAAYANEAASTMLNLLAQTADKVQNNTNEQVGNQRSSSKNEGISNTNSTNSASYNQFGDRYGNEASILRELIRSGELPQSTLDAIISRLQLEQNKDNGKKSIIGFGSNKE